MSIKGQCKLESMMNYLMVSKIKAESILWTFKSGLNFSTLMII